MLLIERHWVQSRRYRSPKASGIGDGTVACAVIAARHDLADQLEHPVVVVRLVSTVTPGICSHRKHPAVRIFASQMSSSFRYRNRGSLATIGRNAAVADFVWLKIDGFPAWLAWPSGFFR